MQVPYAIREGRLALARLVERDKLPSALICGNDVIALGVLFEAMERGVPVPQRLSITGTHRYDRAVEWTRRGINADPGSPNAQFLLAATLAHLDRIKEARVALGRCERMQ
jgi:hypothetical protein